MSVIYQQITGYIKNECKKKCLANCQDNQLLTWIPRSNPIHVISKSEHLRFIIMQRSNIIQYQVRFLMSLCLRFYWCRWWWLVLEVPRSFSFEEQGVEETGRGHVLITGWDVCLKCEQLFSVLFLTRILNKSEKMIKKGCNFFLILRNMSYTGWQKTLSKPFYLVAKINIFIFFNRLQFVWKEDNQSRR